MGRRSSGGIGLGVVGLGRGLTLTLPALRAHPAVRLHGAFDVRPEASRTFADEFGARAYDTIDAMLADPDLDAVYIATPHEAHAAQAIAALAAGKHVLVEKPMATSVLDAAVMARTAREANRVLVIGPSHGFDAPVRLAADLVADGSCGALRMVTALNFTDFMYRPRRPEELGTASAAGVVYSQAAHQIDVVRRIVRRPVGSVRASTMGGDPVRPGIGAYQALLGFDGGVSASLTYSGFAHYDSDELMGWVSELGRPKDPARYGDARRMLAALAEPGAEAAAKNRRAYGGTATAEGPVPNHEHFGFVVVGCAHADLVLKPDGVAVFADAERRFVPLSAPAVPRKSVIDEFVDAVAGRRPPVHDGAWGLVTMACCSALVVSGRDGKDVALAGIDDTIVREPFA